MRRGLQIKPSTRAVWAMIGKRSGSPSPAPAAANWYESDALLALDMTTQTDASSLTPVLGSAVPRTAGTSSTLSGGMLVMPGASTTYDGPTSMLSAPDLTNPLLYAVVLAKFNQTSTLKDVIRISSNPTLNFYIDTGDVLRARMTQTAISLDKLSTNSMAWSDGAAAVFWMFADKTNNKWYYGKNQTEANAAGGDAVTTWPSVALGRGVGTISTSLACKIGSIQVVNRAGMTLAQAKAMVQKMQTLHGL